MNKLITDIRQNNRGMLMTLAAAGLDAKGKGEPFPEEVKSALQAAAKSATDDTMVNEPPKFEVVVVEPEELVEPPTPEPVKEPAPDKPILKGEGWFGFCNGTAKSIIKMYKLLKPRKTNLPILQSVKFDNGIVTVSNLDECVEFKLGNDTGSGCVPLEAIELQAATDAPMKFENDKFFVGKSEFPTLPVEEYPVFNLRYKDNKAKFKFNFDMQEFKFHAKHNVASKEPEDPVVNGILLDVKANKMVSTDKRRLFISKCYFGIGSDEEFESVIVPVNFVKAICEAKVCDDVIIFDDRIEAICDDITVKSRAISGIFPGYQNVIDSKGHYESKVSASKKVWDKIKNLKPIYRHNSDIVTLDIVIKEATVSALENGSVSIGFGETENGSAKVHFDANYFLHANKMVDTMTHVEFNQPLQPIYINDETGTWTYILMPVRSDRV